ncbi:hypothetical protein HDV00_010764 [Rhizophlyctis rosea]|nr:hypothetical protein HDV00_010764 [Rhizophlyctis rosea]
MLGKSCLSLGRLPSATVKANAQIPAISSRLSQSRSLDSWNPHKPPKEFEPGGMRSVPCESRTLIAPFVLTQLLYVQFSNKTEKDLPPKPRTSLPYDPPFVTPIKRWFPPSKRRAPIPQHTSEPQPLYPPAPAPSTWSPQTATALAQLRDQKKHYAIVELHGKPYYVHLHDTIVFDGLRHYDNGDVITLDRVREIGSEEYILQGKPYIDPGYYTIRCVIVDQPTTRERIRIRKMRVSPNKIQRDHLYLSMLRVVEISINKPGGAASS